jgi:hypothetical protein
MECGDSKCKKYKKKKNSDKDARIGYPRREKYYTSQRKIQASALGDALRFVRDDDSIDHIVHLVGVWVDDTLVGLEH